MTDNEITMTSAEFEQPKKRKAIYPHIVVGGRVDDPSYSIHWYDVEKGRMIEGYSSFSLKYVHEWLEEYFEVVEDDIEPLINRQKAEIERLNKEVETFADIGKMYSEIKAEAYREFAVRLLSLIGSVELPNLELRRHINNILNELVGDSNG